jgi:hypothetical protein
MNIGSVSRDLTLQSLQSLQSTSATSSTATDATSDTSTDGSSTVNLSKPGELLKKLSELQKEDPAKFKEVLGKIADSLKTASQSATGTDSTELGKIADKFADAAQSGNLTALRPAHHGGHHGHGGHGQAVQTQDQGQTAQASAGVQRAYGGGGHRGAPPAPSAAVQDAFSSALSIVDDALSSETSGTSATTTAAA